MADDAVSVSRDRPTFKVHDFSARVANQDIYFRVIKMKDSLLLWINDKASMTELAVAMPTRFDTIPIATKLLGPPDNLTSSQLAQRLARRTGKLCFLSYNLPSLPDTSKELIEQRLLEEMVTQPDCF